MRYVQAGEIDRALRAHFKGNGFVVLSEVRNGTGYTKPTRTADMIVASTWPSRGLDLYGIEIKVSRSDLKKELSEPAKADELARFCDLWFLALPDDMNLDGLMIPKTWGLLKVDEKGRVKTEPAAECPCWREFEQYAEMARWQYERTIQIVEAIP